MTSMLPVTTLLFASYAEALGRRSIEVQLNAGATVADLVHAIRQLPGGERLPQHPLVALNQRYAEYGELLTAGDEAAVIPPVAGG